MTVEETAKKLRSVYHNARRGDKCVSVILFAIDHAQNLEGNVPEIIRQSHIPKPYAYELYMGVKLARYVERR